MSSKVLLNEKEVERMLSLSSDLPPLDEVAAPSLVASPARAAPPPVDRMSKRGSSETLVYEESKAHLLKPTSNNPMPTAVPPPIAATAGTLGVRHVLIIIGLPERGKPFIARRLERYLSFFHGAEVRLFDISKYARLEGAGAAGSEANAEHLLADMKKFFSPQNSTAARNMNAARRSVDPAATAADFDQQLIDENDRRRKNVDSGRVGIIFSTDSFGSFKERWSGTSKERRRWAAETIAKEHETLGAKLIFIEVLVDNPSIIEANIRAKRRAQVRAAQFGAILARNSGAQFRLTPPPLLARAGRRADDAGGGARVREADDPLQANVRHAAGASRDPTSLTLHSHIPHILSHCKRMCVTLQDDGSEDDLSYMKLYNYGQKVVTNRMYGYLRMRIAQFLTTVHTTPHTIWLSRHGQSEYNVLGKIGGNPPLSRAGEEYARRLGPWVPHHVCVDAEGKTVKARLWTSSLQVGRNSASSSLRNSL